MNDYNFGNLLYELRTEKKLSQSELGEMFGVSNKAVSKWEMGISKPRPATLFDLASFFQISVEELLAGKRNEKHIDVPFDYSAQEIRLRTEECNRSRRKKYRALFAFLLITAVYIVMGCIIIACGKEDTILGPILTAVALFADFVALLLFFVFYASQRHQKRMLYILFPQRTKEIRQLLIAGKKTVHSEFFQMYAEELLSGKRNEKHTDVPSDYSAQEIRQRVEEYNRSRRKKYMSLSSFALITAVYLALSRIIIVCGKEDTILGPILTAVTILADFAALILFFVFYLSQKQQKRTLYNLFPEQTEEISQLLATTKTINSEGRNAKKLRKFYALFSIMMLSMGVANITLSLTDSYRLSNIALVASVFVFGPVCFVILRFAEKYKTGQNEKNQTKE